MAKNYVVKLNSLEKVEQLLQEIYDQSVKHLNEIQNEMNKLSNSTNLADITLEEKTKYFKAVHDLIGDKNKAIAMKFDIAKFMGEILKHHGDIEKTLDDTTTVKNTKLDINALKRQINEIVLEEPKEYKLKNTNNK
jgi:hypothetical protein